jgi:DNA primase catalytic core
MPQQTTDDPAKQEIEALWNVEELLIFYGADIDRSAPRHARNLSIHCPFHNDEHASCSVCKDKPLFKCGACKEDGDLWKLLLKISGLKFYELKKQLAERYKVKLHHDTPRTQDERRQDTLRWYVNYTHTEVWESPEALAYLHKRGLTDESIKRFKIGFAPADKNMPMREPGQRWVTWDDLLDVGIMRKSAEEDAKPRIRFRNRLIIPTLHKSEVIDIATRSLDDSEEGKKLRYLNLPGCAKGIWGLDNLDTDASTIAVMEGQFDAILSCQAGVPAIALMGLEALWLDWLDFLLSLLSPYTCLAVVMDPDKSGNANIAPLCMELLSRQIPVKVVELVDDTLDPAALIALFIQAGMIATWKQMVDSALPFPCWYFKYLSETQQEAMRDPSRRFKIIEPVLRLLAPINPFYSRGILLQLEEYTQPYNVSARQLNYYLDLLQQPKPTAEKPNGELTPSNGVKPQSSQLQHEVARQSNETVLGATHHQPARPWSPCTCTWTTTT